jgi:D-alanyl-D-alanine carboxypeptidase
MLSLKRVAAFCLTLMLALAALTGNAFALTDYSGEIAYTDEVSPNAVVLIDATTGTILYQQNIDAQIMPASTTKVMTCILALENSSLDEIVTVPPEGDWTDKPGYSTADLKEGEQLSMKDLLYALMLPSGNDAACAIAIHIGGSQEGFAAMMNAKAQELGMTGSHFVTPHGVDTEGHYITVRDMAVLTMYAMQNPTFMEIVGTDSYTIPATNITAENKLTNTDKLILENAENDYYEYATGIKTGYTDDADYCLVSSAEKDGMKLACLVYGDNSKGGEDRWQVAKDLFEFGFANFATLDVQALLDSAQPVSTTVMDAASDDAQGGVLALNKVNTGEAYMTVEKTLFDSIAQSGVTAEVTITGGKVTAPVREGDAIGTVTYTAPDGTVVAQVSLTASRDVAVFTATPAPTATSAPTDKPGIVKVLGLPFWVWIAVGVAVVALIVLIAVLVAHNNSRRARRRSGRRGYGRYPARRRR